MELSIIIINYNTANLLLTCTDSIIKSLENCFLNYEVIIVDNGSKDDSIERIKNHAPRVGGRELRIMNKLKIIENKKNVGFGTANNQGAQIAVGEYLLFLNTDITVLNNSIEKLYKFIRNDDKIKVAGGKLFNKDLTEQTSCGPFFSLPVVFATLFLRGDKIGLTRFSPKKITKVDWVSGACFIMRKSDFERLQGFDEKIFMYMEEVDLFYRAYKKNWQLFFYPEAKFVHLGAATSKNLTIPILNIYKGLLYFYKKHRSASELFVLRLMLNIKALIALLIGYLSGNSYLKKTYQQAWKLARN